MSVQDYVVQLSEEQMGIPQEKLVETEGYDVSAPPAAVTSLK